jgi:hypothetical protein
MEQRRTRPVVFVDRDLNALVRRSERICAQSRATMLNAEVVSARIRQLLRPRVPSFVDDRVTAVTGPEATR